MKIRNNVLIVPHTKETFYLIRYIQLGTNGEMDKKK